MNVIINYMFLYSCYWEFSFVIKNIYHCQEQSHCLPVTVVYAHFQTNFQITPMPCPNGNILCFFYMIGCLICIYVNCHFNLFLLYHAFIPAFVNIINISSSISVLIDGEQRILELPIITCPLLIVNRP